jgi:hypothetical protein
MYKRVMKKAIRRRSRAPRRGALRIQSRIRFFDRLFLRQAARDLGCTAFGGRVATECVRGTW